MTNLIVLCKELSHIDNRRLIYIHVHCMNIDNIIIKKKIYNIYIIIKKLLIIIVENLLKIKY